MRARFFGLVILGGVFCCSGCATPPASAPPLSQSIIDATLSNAAAASVALGKFDEAEQRYRLALVRAPDDIALRLGLATVLAKQVAAKKGQGASDPRVIEANSIFSTLLKERPNALGVLLGAGAGYAALGNSERAMELFERAFNVAEEPEITSIAMRNYATVAFNRGLFGDAVQASAKAYEVNPSAIEANRHLAILNPLGLTKEARTFAGRVLPLYSTDGELLVRVAAAFAAASDCAQAEQVSMRILEQGKLIEDVRRDGSLIIDWCRGKNRFAELRPEELATWPLVMRNSKTVD